MDLFSGIVNNILKGSEAPSLNQRITTEVTTTLNNQALSTKNFTVNSANLLNIKLSELQKYLPDGLKLQLQNSLTNIQPQNIKLNITQAEILGGKVNLSGVATFTDSNNQTRAINFTGEGFVKLQGNSQNSLPLQAGAAQNLSNNLVNSLFLTDAFTLDENTQQIPANLKAFVTEVKPQLLQFITSNSSSSVQLNNLSDSALNIKVVDILLPNNQKVQISDNPLNQSKILVGQLQILPNNEAIIKTELGNFRLNQPVNLPNNTQISFLIDSEPQAQNSLGSQLVSLPTSLSSYKNLLSSEGSVLSNIIKNLYSNNANLGNIGANLFANPTERFAALKALWFMSASRTGNSEKWAGSEAISALKGDSNTTLEYGKDLEEVFGFLKNFAAGNSSDGKVNQTYYSYLMPFYNGQNLSFATLNIDKNYQSENQNGQEKRQKRFTVELEQEEYGSVEIEGKYIMDNNKLESLNFNIRSDKQFDDEFQNELNNLYYDFTQSFGFSGIISFNAFAPNSSNSSQVSVLGEGIVI